MYYDIVNYKGKKYVVFKSKYKDNIVPFVADGKYLNTLLSLKKKWNYRKGGGYISSMFKTKKGDKEIFLHDLLMNIESKYKTPENYIIEHINTIGLDNRIKNLRFTSNEGVRNQKKKKRTVKLPKDCRIDPDDIPTYVWYIKENGNHGDRFVVEIKDKIKWKTTSSKKMSLKYKLEEAKKFLRQLKKTQPDIFKDHCMNGEYTEEGKSLLNEFYDIIKLAGYKVKKKIKLNDITNNFITPDMSDLGAKEKKMLSKKEILGRDKSKSKGSKRRRLISNLPKNCGISVSDLPKYSYYRPSYKNRGEYFVVENHPNQKKRIWQTTTSKKVSLKEKYKELIDYINSIK